MNPVDILSIYISDQSDVVEDGKSERKRHRGINYGGLTGTQDMVQ